MKTYIVFFLLLLLGITSYAQSLNGKWNGKMTTPNGDFELVYTFNVNGDSLSGDVTSDRGSIPIENGKINGNQFSFDININGRAFTNTGILEGDTVKLSSPRRDRPMILTRVSEKSKINGKWLGKVSSPQGEFELTFTFIVDGNKLTGKNSSAMGEIDITNGVVNGNDFSFDVDVQGMTISHKCKYLDNDTIDVNTKIGDQDMNMKLTRAAE